MRIALLGTSFLLAACGTDLTAGDSEPVGVVRQEGNVNQGNVNQGNVNQGNVNQGPWLGAKVINAATVRFTDGAGAASVSGTVLMRGSTPVRPAPATAKGRVVVATFEVRDLTTDRYGMDELGTKRVNARLIGSFVDAQNYGAGDSLNMLDAPYRDRDRRGNLVAQNQDVVMYQVEVEVPQPYPAVSTWVPLCAQGTPGNAAILFPGYFDGRGQFKNENWNFIGFACADGTAAKCTRWGYKHWRSLTPPGSSTPVSLKPLFQACTRAAMADYCGANVSNTSPGTEIDIFDAYGFIKATPESTAWSEQWTTSAESAFDENGALCVAHDRIGTLLQCPVSYQFDNGSSCIGPDTGWGWSSCGPKSLTNTSYTFERGALGACSTNAFLRTGRNALVMVSSGKRVCSHPPSESGGAALARDCNCTTNAVCGRAGVRPDGRPWSVCCQMDDGGVPLPNAWDPACSAEAQRVSSLALDCSQLNQAF